MLTGYNLSFYSWLYTCHIGMATALSMPLDRSWFEWNGDDSRLNSMTGYIPAYPCSHFMHCIQQKFKHHVSQGHVSFIPGLSCMGLTEMLHWTDLPWPFWGTSPCYASSFCVGYVRAQTGWQECRKTGWRANANWQLWVSANQRWDTFDPRMQVFYVRSCCKAHH